MNLWPDREFHPVPPVPTGTRCTDGAKKAKKRKYSKGAEESSRAMKKRKARMLRSFRHATLRSFAQERQEPQASHRDRSLRGAQARRPGAEDEKNILARGLRRVRCRACCHPFIKLVSAEFERPDPAIQQFPNAPRPAI